MLILIVKDSATKVPREVATVAEAATSAPCASTTSEGMP